MNIGYLLLGIAVSLLIGVILLVGGLIRQSYRNSTACSGFYNTKNITLLNSESFKTDSIIWKHDGTEYYLILSDNSIDVYQMTKPFDCSTRTFKENVMIETIE